jgi:hypothetical protein
VRCAESEVRGAKVRSESAVRESRVKVRCESAAQKCGAKERCGRVERIYPLNQNVNKVGNIPSESASGDNLAEWTGVS